MTFRTLYGSLPRLRVECDVQGSRVLYHHVFTEPGCSDATFEGSLDFTSNDGSVFDASDAAVDFDSIGCRRVRLFIRRSNTSGMWAAPKHL